MLWVGDCRAGLRSFLADGVRAQVCVTSPPYWGLRDYGEAGQLGLEPTIAEYVASMVEVFRLVREVLAEDGTLWLNLGDSYCNSDKCGYQSSRVTAEDSLQRGNLASDFIGAPNRQPQAGLKPKDLAGIPWRVAFALQADGWYLRQDIIWAKPNPMPESVTDRCTKAHEYLFLLSKRATYYFDAAAIAEPCIDDIETQIIKAKTRNEQRGKGDKDGIWNPRGNAAPFANQKDTRNRRSVWTITTQPYSEAHFAVMPTALVEPCIMAGSRVGDVVLDPFMGSGTVAQVAQDLGRRWLGCELSPDYAEMIRRRTSQQAFEFAVC